MIYLDNHATTQCDPAVVEAMLPFLTENYGNASSSHSFGQSAAEAVYDAQIKIANLINSQPKEIVFTSGATESNNIALLGIAHAYKSRAGSRRQIVTTKIEHKAVLAPLEQLSKEGWELIYLPVNQYGEVNIEQAQQLITEDTFLVSIQLANSEIGTIQPIHSIAQIAKDKGAIVHCDAAQAIGKIRVDVQELGIDMLSISGHKMYGPKGIGALWITESYIHALAPLMFGGFNINSIRPGTLPVYLIVGLGKAFELTSKQMVVENNRIINLRNSFETTLLNKFPQIIINGSIESRLPNNSNITFTGVDSEALLANIPEVIASTGSACESGSIEPSRVLLEIGLSREQAFCTLRFGLGRFTTKEELSIATANISFAYDNLQELNW